MPELGRVHGAGDAPGRPLQGERVGVVGYGHLGRSVALNLRDGGIAVEVGNRDDAHAARAREDGFTVRPVAQVASADVVFVLLPDEVIPEVFETEIAPALQSGAALAFASGYDLAYGLVSPPDHVDVLLVAPRMAGEEARARFVRGEGFWAYVGVERDVSGRARSRMLGLAAGIGALREGALEMGAETEALLDLYIEQTVGPLIGTAIMVAFEVGIEGGIPAEALVLEMYMSGELETVFQSFREQGFFRASESHGPTALYGGMLRTMEMDRAGLADRFRTVLQEIRDGRFARQLQQERAEGYPTLQMARQMTQGDSPMTRAEARIRRRQHEGAP